MPKKPILKNKIIEIASHSDLTNRQIAGLTGASDSTVDHVLADYRSSLAQIKDFKNNRPEVFASLQKQSSAKISDIIHSLNIDAMDTKSKTFAINALNNVLGTSYDKERLELGQSTSNIVSICQAIDAKQESKWTKMARADDDK